MLGDLNFLNDLSHSFGKGIAENAGQAAAEAITAFGNQAREVILAARLPKQQLNQRFGVPVGGPGGEFGSGFGFGGEGLKTAAAVAGVLAIGYIIYDKTKKKS